MLEAYATPPPLRPNSGGSSGPVIPWYFKSGMLVVAFLVVGPLMLPLLWFNPHVNRIQKLVWTIIILAVSFLLAVATMKAISTLTEYYRMMTF
jgi:hypothetical protein